MTRLFRCTVEPPGDRRGGDGDGRTSSGPQQVRPGRLRLYGKPRASADGDLRGPPRCRPGLLPGGLRFAVRHAEHSHVLGVLSPDLGHQQAAEHIDCPEGLLRHQPHGLGRRPAHQSNRKHPARMPGAAYRCSAGSAAPSSPTPAELGDSRSAPAMAAPAPTEKISNLQVTAVDATSVSVTWDAVEHATSYDVSWSARAVIRLTQAPALRA